MLLKNIKTNYLIFTDLDGTLLDHETYKFDEAKEMLDFIKQNDIPLIIVTSKTKDEVIELQKNSKFLILLLSKMVQVFLFLKEMIMKLSL